MITVEIQGKAFVPNGSSRRETAILLLGTAEEHGIDPTKVKAVNRGFEIPLELAEVLYDEGMVDDADDLSETDLSDTEPDEEGEDMFLPSDYNIDQVKEFVNDNPETAQDVLLSEQAGENRATLVKWLTDTINKQNASEEE